jgi:ABC-type lipoprotein export system ATPase subunit
MLKKNYILKRRMPKTTFLEIITPVILVGALCILRTQSTAVEEPKRMYVDTARVGQCGVPGLFEYPCFEENNTQAGNILVNLDDNNRELHLHTIRMASSLSKCAWFNGKVLQDAGCVDSLVGSQFFVDGSRAHAPSLQDMVLASMAFDTTIAVVAPPAPTAAFAAFQTKLTTYLENFGGLDNQELLRGELTALAALCVPPASCQQFPPLDQWGEWTVAEQTNYVSTTWPALVNRVFNFDFTSEAALDNYLAQQSYNDNKKVGSAIVFKSFPEAEATADVEYSIRLNYTGNGARPSGGSVFAPPSLPLVCYTQEGCGARYIPPTNVPVLNTVSKSMQFGAAECSQAANPRGVCAQLSYANSGFLTLQQLVESFVVDAAATEVVPTSVGLFPEPRYRTDNFAEVISGVLPLFVILSFILPVSQLIRALVLEKERKIKEGMKMMGLFDSVFYTSWFVTAFLQFMLISVLMTIVTANGTNYAIFLYSDGGLVFLFFASFSLSIITLCWLISVFFSKSKTAATVGVLLFFATYFPSIAVANPETAMGAKTFASLLSPTAFSLGLGVFADQEGGQVGVLPGNAGVVTASNYSYSTCITMMLFDFFFYAFMGWYLDKVLPSDYGTRRSACFCCSDALRGILGLFGGSTGAASGRSASRVLLQGDDGEIFADQPAELAIDLDDSSAAELDGMIEPVAKALADQEASGKCVKIEKLRKVFPNKAGNGAPDKIAVSSLDLTAYEGQITALLGHNGAGKTTTISMLTGLIPPSSGDAIVSGNRLSTSAGMTAIRLQLGVCPQHDILFDALTVEEHLQLFAVLKGVAADDVEETVAASIRHVGLTEKVRTQSSSLSGGMKRKLSVAIALIGGSKVVVLDEPTR